MKAQKKSIAIFLLLILLTSVIACRRTIAPDGRKSSDEFFALIKSHPYRASEERKSRLLQNYSKLSFGISKDQVASLLGEPDYSRILFDIGSGDTGSVWVYYLYKNDEAPNTLTDQTINVFFDKDSQMDWVVPHNIEGLKEMRDPSLGAT